MNHRVLVRAIIIVAAMLLIIQGLAELVRVSLPWGQLHLIYLDLADSGSFGNLRDVRPENFGWLVLLAGGVALLIGASRIAKMLVRTNRFCHSCGYD